MVKMGLKSHSNSIAIPNSFSSKDEIRVIAQKIAAQPAYISRPGVWGVLTAISDKACKRSQGLDILMHGDEHILGRTVKETSCRFESPNVSGRHCRVYRKKGLLENAEQSTGTCYFVFLKDSSSNGTYLNWEKLKKDSPEAQIQHGDIISLVNPPEHENSFAFVFREIRQELPCSHQQDSVSNINAKRKVPIADIFGEDFVSDSKRIKAPGILGPAGPVSLHEVRRLQQSNEDLCQQLEAHVLTIEKLQTEAQAARACYDNELKELQESMTVSPLEEMKEIRHELAMKEKELEETVVVSTWKQSCIEDLNQQLAAARQSQTDVEEIIKNQKAAITELERQLAEERSQWRDEREKAESCLKAAARQQKEQLVNMCSQKAAITELERQLAEERSQWRDKREKAESCLKAAARQQKEQLVIINKLEAAQEDAWAKVSSLELELAAAIRDLGHERQQLQRAQERFVLRETQLQAFHSAAEEITALQKKQKKLLHGMSIILEDGKNCEFTNTNNDFEIRTENLCREVTRAREEIMAGNIETCRIQWEEAASDHAEMPKNVRRTDCAGDSDGVEKCHMNKTKIGDALKDWEDGDTQGEDCAKILCSMRNHDSDHFGTEQMLATEADETQLLESRKGGRRIEFHTYAMGSQPARTSENIREKILEDDEVEDGEGGLGGKTMQLEDKCQAPTGWGTDLAGQNPATLYTRGGAEPERLPDMDNNGQYMARTRHPLENSLDQDRQSPFPVNQQCGDEMDSRNKEEEHTVATIDLLTSEVAGSWAVSTVGSVRGDNESLRSDDRQPGTGRISDEGINQDFDASQVAASDNLRSRQDSHSLKCQDTQPEDAAAGSQNSPVPRLATQQIYENQALNETLDIVNADFKQLHRPRRINDNARCQRIYRRERNKNHSDDGAEEDSCGPESE